MTPEELALMMEIKDLISQGAADSQGPIYTLLTIIAVSFPLIAARFNKYINSLISAQSKNTKELLIQQGEKMDEVITSMSMYVEEIVAIKENHEELKESVEEVKGDIKTIKRTVRTHNNKLKEFTDKLKDFC